MKFRLFYTHWPTMKDTPAVSPVRDKMDCHSPPDHPILTHR